jgi:hypothetical protein
LFAVIKNGYHVCIKNGNLKKIKNDQKAKFIIPLSLIISGFNTKTFFSQGCPLWTTPLIPLRTLVPTCNYASNITTIIVRIISIIARITRITTKLMPKRRIDYWKWKEMFGSTNLITDSNEILILVEKSKSQHIHIYLF